jgi:hypothetical protein
MECSRRWGTTHAGLYTFAQSPQHAALYQKFGFYPRFLTAIMSKIVDPAAATGGWTRLSDVPEAKRDACLEECRALTGAAYEGMDVAREIRGVAAQAIGDTVLVRDGRELVALGICHVGRGSEAGSGACYVKFGMVRPGPRAAEHFARLLDASEELASARGAALLVAGVNLACTDAYRALGARGFRTDFQGVAMHRPNEPCYHRPDIYVIDDWR